MFDLPQIKDDGFFFGGGGGGGGCNTVRRSYVTSYND